jgi:DNA-binding transcriptional MerR regulator
MLTIAPFAELCGISASALRFYERRRLLLPARRLANGYRAYAPEQATTARLINSLREAGIGLGQIQQFLEANEAERDRLMGCWRAEVADRLASIRLAGQYLDAVTPDEPQIHLQRWAEPSLLLWFPARAAAAPLPFARAVADAAPHAAALGRRHLGGGFVRTLDLADGWLTGEVGLRARCGRGRLPADARVQEVPPTRFATLECGVDDQKAAHRVFRFLDDFGFTATGFHLERYLPGFQDRYQVMIAIRHTPAAG